MMKYRLPALVAAVVASGSASAALADDQNMMADVVCSKTANVAEVRVGWEDDCYNKGHQCLRTFTRLDRQVDGSLSSRPLAHPFRSASVGQCVLPNGKKVRVRLHEDTKQATGTGEADPSAYVTLWVGKQRLLSHAMVYGGHATDNPWVAAILINGSRLRYCTRADNDFQEASKPVRCADKAPVFQNLPIKVRR